MRKYVYLKKIIFDIRRFLYQICERNNRIYLKFVTQSFWHAPLNMFDLFELISFRAYTIRLLYRVLLIHTFITNNVIISCLQVFHAIKHKKKNRWFCYNTLNPKYQFPTWEGRRRNERPDRLTRDDHTMAKKLSNDVFQWSLKIETSRKMRRRFYTNNNESFNNVLWRIAPKVTHSGSNIAKIASYIAACTFNTGS